MKGPGNYRSIRFNQYIVKLPLLRNFLQGRKVDWSPVVSESSISEMG